MAVYTAGFAAYWRPAGSWVNITSHIQSIEGDFELTGDRSNALSFGDSSTATFRVETVDLALQGTAYLEVPFKADFTINGVTEPGVYGLIVSRERSLANLTFACEGLGRLVNRTRVYSPMFERVPAATKTTATSIENPDQARYAAGPINYALWKSGLRPYEQISSYPLSATVKGYYSVPEYAILAPDYAWLAGENAWDECLNLARACGGQLTQDRDGVIRYRQPLSYGDGTSAITFDASVYGDLKEGARSDQTATKIICPVIPRTRQLVQEVIKDDTVRRLKGNASLTVTLEPQYPIVRNGWALRVVQNAFTGPRTYLPADAIKLVFGDGGVPVLNVDYTYTVETAAQQLTLRFTNLKATPITITNIIVQGAPLVAGETNTVEGGTGDTTMTVPDNPYIQSVAHAERLIAMMLAFHAETLPIVTASDLVYNPALEIGDAVDLTAAEWSMSAVKHLIVSLRHSETGAVSEYDLVDVSSLPASSEFFIIGPTNYTGQSKLLGF